MVFFLSLYVFPSKGALGYEACIYGSPESESRFMQGLVEVVRIDKLCIGDANGGFQAGTYPPAAIGALRTCRYIHELVTGGLRQGLKPLNVLRIPTGKGVLPCDLKSCLVAEVEAPEGATSPTKAETYFTTVRCQCRMMTHGLITRNKI